MTDFTKNRVRILKAAMNTIDVGWFESIRVRLFGVKETVQETHEGWVVLSRYKKRDYFVREVRND
ncbi:hypothetical protein [Marinobacter sp.]|uniref:hypothetical protein n=1 Tax=Marinobacter sp. TaxID=50741 RepID=UPI000C8E9AE6|nr:hypothetical protein [Marinobacter sp.]MAB53453.1 hypothetical protein [Marinobacter sp.]|tara:strand:+ start:4373 stop:4567 length:195 start_codon:yes stop_codon:yes gene_type:complete